MIYTKKMHTEKLKVSTLRKILFALGYHLEFNYNFVDGKKLI